MENFIVSARKYRPATFSSVVGQASIIRTLKSAVQSNQLAQAFLFTGPRGVGKTTCARILAKTINCPDLTPEGEACDHCTSCKSFNESASFNILELDAASNNSVDDIRNLVDQVRIPPQAGKYKVYIIDEVHMLSANAFNAFLKTLEEPPAYAKFILATTEKHKIIPTILSRCQIYDFHRITVDDIAGHLKWVAGNEGILAESEALHIIAQKADGALRDALSIFDQIVSYAGKEITYQAVIDNLNVLDYDYYFRITEYVSKADITSAFLLLNEIIEKGFDGHQFLNGFGEHLRNLLVCKDPATVKLLEVAESTRKRYLQQSSEIKLPFLIKVLEINNKADIAYKTASNKRLQIELCLLQMSALNPLIPNAEVVPSPAPVKEESSRQTPVKAPPPPAPLQQPPPTATTAEPEPKPLEQAVEPVSKPTDVDSIMSRVPGLSIRNAGNANSSVEEPVEEYNEKPGEKPVQSIVAKEDVIEALKKYAGQISESQMAFSICLKAANPEILGNNVIELPVDNKLFEDKTLLKNLLGFLRAELKNQQLWLTSKLVEVEPAIIRPSRPEDKFRQMNEKNPELENFARQLNLDLDA